MTPVSPSDKYSVRTSVPIPETNQQVMNVVPIFQALPAEINEMISQFLSNHHLFVLSSVNKELHETLSNEYFKKLCLKQYPSVAKYSEIFATLRNDHPQSCWKVICCTLPRGIHEEKPFSIGASFIQRAIPNISRSLELENRTLEGKLKKICGSFQPDSNASLIQARNACLEIENQLTTSIRVKYPEIVLECEEMYSADDLPLSLTQIFCCVSDEIVSDLTDEELNEALNGNLEITNEEDRLPIACLREVKNKIKEVEKLESEYFILRRKIMRSDPNSSISNAEKAMISASKNEEGNKLGEEYLKLGEKYLFLREEAESCILKLDQVNAKRTQLSLGLKSPQALEMFIQLYKSVLESEYLTAVNTLR
jgi:hypothetical protein